MGPHRSRAAKSKQLKKRRKKLQKTSPPKRQRQINLPSFVTVPATLALSVDQFCAAHNISRDLFYALVRSGHGPACMMLGKRRLISLEASERWRAEREAATAAEVASA
jgi:excisionase family DNA binding protein